MKTVNNDDVLVVVFKSLSNSEHEWFKLLCVSLVYVLFYLLEFETIINKYTIYDTMHNILN